jgi:glycerol-3-phosphate acyltransferase PlsY
MIEFFQNYGPYIVLGYSLGSIPTGVVLGHFMGADPRTSGSGNIGASNVTRILGKKAGAITLLVDVGKGVLATALSLKLGGQSAALLAGVFAIFGHCFPIWLKFKGGKGVATAFGVMAVILPVVAIISTLVWVTMLYFTRTPALGSMVAAALFVFLPQVEETPFEIHCFTLSISLLLIIRHVGNMRILKARHKAKQERKKRR